MIKLKTKNIKKMSLEEKEEKGKRGDKNFCFSF